MPEKQKMTFKDLRKKFRSNASVKNLNLLGKEGEDHINISIQSETKIGKIFDPAYLKVINYKYIGKFNSVLSLWYWLRSPTLDDNIRRLTGRNLKLYVQSKGDLVKFVPNFKAIIGQATWIKIKSYPSIINEIKNLDDNKELVSYHIIKSSGLRVATSYADFIIDIARVIIQAVKEDKEPDFSVFVDYKDKADMLYLEGFLERAMPTEVIERMRNSEEPDKEEDSEYISEEDTTGEDSGSLEKEELETVAA